MKKLAVLFFVVMTASIFAQENSIGPTIGYNHAWLTRDGVSARPAFNAGVVYNNSFQEHWGAGAELKYSLEGAKVDGTDQNIDLSYIRLPLRLMYFFGSYGDAFRPKIYAGPSLAFLASAKTKTGSNKIDVIDSYERFDVGILGGIGFNYRLREQTWLNVDLGYTHGLIDLDNSASIKSHNRLLNANVGVAFGF